eukprot:COSAG01_NODE_3106_length_6575_cov_25.785207_2_plen_325_part_00
MRAARPPPCGAQRAAAAAAAALLIRMVHHAVAAGGGGRHATLLWTFYAATTCVVGRVGSCYPGQTPCGHPHKNLCCGVPSGPAPAPAPVHVFVDPHNVTHRTNPLFNGCHSDSGFTHQPRGFYAQMVLGESFEGLNLSTAEHTASSTGLTVPPSPKSPGSPRNPWSPYRDNRAEGSAFIDAGLGFHGHSSLSLAYNSGSGVLGLANRGLAHEGLVFQPARSYDGYFFAQADAAVTFQVAIQDYVHRRTLASTNVSFHPARGASGWQRLNFSLTTSAGAGTHCVDVINASDPEVDCDGTQQVCVKCGGQIVIGLAAPGQAHVDYM